MNGLIFILCVLVILFVVLSVQIILDKEIHRITIESLRLTQQNVWEKGFEMRKLMQEYKTLMDAKKHTNKNKKKAKKK